MRGLKARCSRLESTAEPGYAVQISAVLEFDCSSRNFDEIKGSKLFVLPRPFLFLTTSYNMANNQPYYYRRTMASTSTNATTKKAANHTLASPRDPTTTLSSPKCTILQDWLSPEQPPTMKATPGKLLTDEYMESRVSTLAHMVGQAYASSKWKSNKQQVPYGIPQFIRAFGIDASSPKPTGSREEISRSGNCFVQLFVNAA
jgi:hypothetical protein